MQSLKSIFLLPLTVLLITSCNDDSKKPTDTLSSGNIDISVDETYQPVIKEQLKVFDSIYPNATINVHYKPESECFKDYFDNKARLILVTRPLTKAEKVICDQKQIAPSSLAFAKDAVAVIVNNSAPDSVLGIAALKGILTGVYQRKYTVVFDNQGSSTLRYILDSLLHSTKLGSNVFAAKGNNEVVDYVAKNPGAIGFVGLGYISDSNDENNTGKFISKIRVIQILNDTDNKPYLPYQAFIALKSYPLTRNLYYVSRESYPGLGTGFANFLTREQGQLIFAHAHLFPLRMNIVIRDAAINNQ